MTRIKVSDQSVNSYGLRVITSGGKFDRFHSNPVMLHMHDQMQLIGKWINLAIEGEDIYLTPVFDDGDEDAKKRKGQYERGFLKGASVGITPLKLLYNEKDDVVDIVEWEWKETSLCPIPSNENAIALYDDKGMRMSEQQILQLSSNSKTNIEHLKNNMKNSKTIAKVLNLAADATEDAIAEAIQEVVTERDDLKEDKVELSDANKKLKSEVKTLKDAAKDAQKGMSVSLIDGAITAGKILPAEREEWLELADANFEGTKKVLDKKKGHQSISSRINNTGSDTDGSGGSGAELEFADATKGYDWDKFFAEGKVVELKEKQPERYAELYEKKFKKKPTS